MIGQMLLSIGRVIAEFYFDWARVRLSFGLFAPFCSIR